MKKVLTSLVLFSVFTMYSQEKLKIFNATIQSSDVRGKDTYGPTNFIKNSGIINDPMVTNSFVGLLGKFVKNNQPKDLDQLLDLSTFRTDFPILDELDMDYYTNFAIDNILDPEFDSDADYLRFREAFLKAADTKQMKQVLLDRVNRKWKLKLFESKYDFVNESNFTNVQTIAKEIHFSIQSKVMANLEQKYKIDVNGELGIAIRNLIDKNITVTGIYKEVEYCPEYRTLLNEHLSKYLNKPAKEDTFSKNLKLYFDDPGAGIICAIALLKLELSYDKTKINIASIKALVSASAQKSSADQISADIFSNLSLTKTYEGQAQITTIYNVKYGYDTNLEILQSSVKK